MGRLLLVLPVRAIVKGGSALIDSQAHNGLRLWLEHFDHITIACQTTNIDDPSFMPLEAFGDRLTFRPLPDAYLPHQFMMTLPRLVKTLSSEIDRCDYLHFAIGGLWGDWPTVGAFVAMAKGRPYAVWTDNVGSKFHLFRAQHKRGLARFYTILTSMIMGVVERFVIRKSQVGLFHGMDCFDTYAKYCKQPFLVHNIHLSAADRATPADIDSRAKSGPIRIAYAGRVSSEKGVFDWIEAIKLAIERGCNVEAVWFGDGPQLSPAIQTANDPRIKFYGPIEHRRLIRELKSFDLFVFCHKIKESPRCLIEALMCGLPIVGYDSSYPRSLISNGGGILTDSTPHALSMTLASLSRDRLKLLTEEAMKDGSVFSDKEVFRHRAEIIKDTLPRPASLR